MASSSDDDLCFCQAEEMFLGHLMDVDKAPLKGSPDGVAPRYFRGVCGSPVEAYHAAGTEGIDVGATPSTHVDSRNSSSTMTTTQPSEPASEASSSSPTKSGLKLRGQRAMLHWAPASATMLTDTHDVRTTPAQAPEAPPTGNELVVAIPHLEPIRATMAGSHDRRKLGIAKMEGYETMA